jgi:hypothetical protein
MKSTVSQAGAKGSAIPKVNATLPEGFERETQIKVITGMFSEYGSSAGNNHWIESVNRLSDERVSKLKDICDGFEEKLHVGRLRISTDAKHVEMSVLLGDGAAIDFYHRYRNEATGAYSYIQMDEVRKVLKRLGVSGPNPLELETMDAHIRAAMTYVPLTSSTGKHANPNDPYYKTYEFPAYAMDKNLVQFVERYPDRVDDIMRFREERKSSKYDDLEKYLKEADTLGTPAIMEGWL